MDMIRCEQCKKRITLTNDIKLGHGNMIYCVCPECGGFNIVEIKTKKDNTFKIFD